MIGSITTVYNEIAQHPTTGALDRLTRLLQENLKALSADAQDHTLLYRNIKKLSPELAQIVKTIEIRAEFLHAGCRNEKILDLIGSTTVPGEELVTIKAFRGQLLHSGPEIDQELSRLIGLALDLKDKPLREVRKISGAPAYASWINLNKIPLADTGLALNEIEAIAHYLHYVDCRGLNIDQSFISLCTNAYHLFLDSDKFENLVIDRGGLQTLYISCAQLKTLTFSVCAALASITLASAPKLQNFLCSHCPALTAISFPSAPELQWIFFLDCIAIASITLTSAPQLRLFSCTDSPNLTTLPLTLGESHGLTHVEINNSGVDPAIRTAILNQSRAMRDAEAVAILPSRLEKWKAIAKSKEDLDISALSLPQKMILNEWLVRMEHTRDFALAQTLLAHTVCSILADLFKNKEFQELFFPQAEANNTCCEDRAAMALNEIYTSWKIICGRENLKVMTGVAKTLRLRKELQKLIRGDEGESVEIFLYYESTLRERLQLVTAIQNMTYNQIGKRSWIDQDRLVQEVEAHFFEELFELPAFQKMIVFDEREFSTQLEQLGECPPGDPHDPQVLNYQHRQGEIMQEWKRKKMLFAKRWYNKEIS